MSCYADASHTLSSIGQLQRPSLLLSARRAKHVQFAAEDAAAPQRQGLIGRMLAALDPDRLLMRMLDDFRVLLCLYEMLALPMRLALGTGYNRLGSSR